MWLLLLGFPLELWTSNVLENIVHNFIHLDKKNLFVVEKKMVRDMVKVDIDKGLLPKFEIFWGDKIFQQ